MCVCECAVYIRIHVYVCYRYTCTCVHTKLPAVSVVTFIIFSSDPEDTWTRFVPLSSGSSRCLSDFGSQHTTM